MLQIVFPDNQVLGLGLKAELELVAEVGPHLVVLHRNVGEPSLCDLDGRDSVTWELGLGPLLEVALGVSEGVLHAETRGRDDPELQVALNVVRALLPGESPGTHHDDLDLWSENAAHLIGEDDQLRLHDLVVAADLLVISAHLIGDGDFCGVHLRVAG